MIELSIIIPVYNVDEYINRCIDSIIVQNLSPDLYEIIIINDGSTDNSKSIIEDLTKKYTNIRSINIKNSGVSVARNIGISNSTGQLIMFVDPDDSLPKGSLKQVINLDPNSFNVIIARSFNNGKEVYAWTNKFKDGEIIDSIKALNLGYVRGSVCGCVFSRRFLKKNKIFFPEGIVNCEDTIFLFNCLSINKNVIFRDIILYNVIGRPNSASKTFNEVRVNSMLKSIQYVNDLLLKNEGKLDSYKENVWGFLKYILIAHMTDAIINTKKFKFSKALKILRKIDLHINCPNILRKKIYISILNNSYCSYYFLRKIYQTLYTIYTDYLKKNKLNSFMRKRGNVMRFKYD